MNIKRVYRYFYGFPNKQQRFLNRMAKDGWRLVRTGRISYVFEPSAPNAYSYCVDFVAHQSAKDAKDYQDFLVDMGYRVLTKPVNINYSFGKVRLRPWGKGWGKIATNPGAFNKELLIVEKKDDGRPFELHTTLEDRIAYYRTQRSAWGMLTLALVLFAVYSVVRSGWQWKAYALAALALFHLWPAWQSHHILKQLKNQSKVSDF